MLDPHGHPTNDAKLLFWKAHVFGMPPNKLLEQSPFADAVDTIIFNAGFKEYLQAITASKIK